MVGTLLQHVMKGKYRYAASCSVSVLYLMIAISRVKLAG